MSLLERVIVAHRCRSTHHYIAMDSLALLDGPDAEKWRNLILVHNEELLKGAKAPDAVFKDFKNHVLHVGEGEWGGARQAAMAWYSEAVCQLKAKKWAKAVYALGVMSHYYADPIQPFHTGQTEEEGAIHRAVEWSIAKSRDTIKARIGEIGYPEIEAGDGPGFVSDMVRAGAEKSHPHYFTLINHYDIDAGAKNPPAGLDQTLIDIIAELVAYATAGLATIFTRAFAEAGVAAPKVHITVPGYLATLDIPVHWVARKLDDVADKRTVEAMYKELKTTGKVVKKLPDDDKAIRKLHARQVLRKPLKELNAQALGPLGENHIPRPEYVSEVVETSAEFETSTIESAEDVAVIPTVVEEIAAEATDTAADREAERLEAEEAARLAAEDAERLAAEEAKRIEEENAARAAAEEAERQAAEDAVRLAAEEAEQAAEEEAKRLAEEEAARLAAEEAERLAIEEADKAKRLAEDEAAQLEAREVARVVAEEAERLQAADEAVPDEIVETADETDVEEDMEFSIEELAAFETNLTDTATEEAEPVAPPVESFFEESTKRSRTLSPSAPVIDAPSIGKKTARRLNRVGIETIQDLLECDVEEIAFEIDVRHITEDTLLDWKAQTQLMVEVPGLRAHDAQILVGVGVKSAEDLAEASVADIFKASMSFLTTSRGSYIAQHNYEVEEDRIEDWVDRAKGAKAA